MLQISRKTFLLVHEISEMMGRERNATLSAIATTTSFADKGREDGFGGGSTKGLWMCTRGN